MAIEDAVELARQLRRPGTVADALARFDAARRDRAGKMAKTAAANRDAKTAGPITAALRNLIMPVIFDRFYERATGWLYDYAPGVTQADGKVTGLEASRNGLSCRRGAGPTRYRTRPGQGPGRGRSRSRTTAAPQNRLPGW